MKYEIRLAREENLDEVFELWKKLMEEHKKMDPAFFSDIDEGLYKNGLIEFYFSNAKEIFVAICEGKIVGYISTSIWIGSLYNTMLSCIIDDLMVDSQYRKMGIGKALIEKMKDWADENMADRIELNVIHKNTKGYEFFKRYGFQDSWHKLELNL